MADLLVVRAPVTAKDRSRMLVLLQHLAVCLSNNATNNTRSVVGQKNSPLEKIGEPTQRDQFTEETFAQTLAAYLIDLCI